MPRQRKTRVQTVRPTANARAAGIDIGAREIYAAVPTELTAEPVRSFPTFTEDLHELVKWLQGFQIKTVAMEATSVYWIPLAELLEEVGIEVCLVNPRHVKNVPGRKSDVMDCQWLQYLHSVGLLRGAFRPAPEVRASRALWRHRDALIRHSGWHIQHMHKALDQMNLQIHHVITDITGVTGTAIVEAILAGERDPARMATLRDPRVRATEKTLQKALTGDYRAEHLFCLRQAYKGWNELRQHAETTGGNGYLCLTGPAGSGKSALLGKFCQDYREAHPQDLVIPHFVGASPHSAPRPRRMRLTSCGATFRRAWRSVIRPDDAHTGRIT